jgi:hypothetical protein
VSPQQTARLPLPVPVVRPRDPKAVGVRNRGRNLVGRTDPDDVPIAKQESPSPAEAITKANAWREVYKEEVSQPSHFTLRTDDARKYENGSDNFDAYQFREQTDNALLAAFSIERLPPGGVSGISSGAITGSPTRGPRHPKKKTWWAFHKDKVEELVRNIAASSDWPPGSDKRAGYIVLYFFQQSFEVEEIHKEIPKVFASANAVEQFKKGLVNYAFELFGPDPDAKPESFKKWAQKLPDIKSKLSWSLVAVHSSTLGVGLGKRRGRNK